MTGWLKGRVMGTLKKLSSLYRDPYMNHLAVITDTKELIVWHPPLQKSSQNQHLF